MIDNSLIMEAANRLVEKFHPRQIILFGSQARGTADRHSDIDLLVLHENPGDRRRMAVAMDAVLWGLKVACDIIVMTPAEFEVERQIPGTLARPAWREGRILYEQ
jgi:predicted nucleotidyltransferase